MQKKNITRRIHIGRASRRGRRRRRDGGTGPGKEEGGRGREEKKIPPPPPSQHALAGLTSKRNSQGPKSIRYVFAIHLIAFSSFSRHLRSGDSALRAATRTGKFRNAREAPKGRERASCRLPPLAANSDGIKIGIVCNSISTPALQERTSRTRSALENATEVLSVSLQRAFAQKRGRSGALWGPIQELFEATTTKEKKTTSLLFDGTVTSLFINSQCFFGSRSDASIPTA